ncbi:hypothetical protein EI94DRAFT_1205969 [Lactarius quietus]|nr:hypothetical protein EI94DRAFT_1205969 [Lactarius quietus]
MPRRPTFYVRAEEEQLIGSVLPVDDAWNEYEYLEPPPLGVKLTGYRLLNVGVILVFGATKAALAFCGQSLALTMLDWMAGTSSAVILYWIGQVKTQSGRQSRWLLFFHLDWAPDILDAVKSVGIPCEYALYLKKFNGLNCCAQLAEPRLRTLQDSDWSPVDFLRRHPRRHYLSTLTIAFLYIALLYFERSSLFLVS